MKKTIFIVLAVIILMVASLFVLPVFFKKNVIEITQNTLNKHINAKVQFDDLSLSLFRNFPKATIIIQNMVITGKGDFVNDTLFSVESAKATTGITSLFKKTGGALDELILDNPKLMLKVNANGSYNWDLVPVNAATGNQATPVQNNTPENAYVLKLEKVKINNAGFWYIDDEAKMLVRLLDMNIDITGTLDEVAAGLQVTGKAGDFMVEYDSVKYISNSTIETTSLMNWEFETSTLWIVQNELLLNRLPLEVIGSVEMPSDSMLYSLQFKTKESDFSNFLALVPVEYEKYMKDVTTSGTATVSGYLRGVYYEENYPAFSLLVNASQGTVQFAGLPDKVEKIRADVEILKPQGGMDLTEINIKAAHAEIRKNPVDLKLSLKNLFDNMQFDGKFIGAVNFSEIKDALPLQDVNVSGMVNANIIVKGDYAAVENEQYDKIMAVGMVQLKNFVYDSPSFTQKIEVPTGVVEFSPKFMILRGLNMNIGESDFALTGRISNYLNYIVKDGTIQGDLALNSTFLNMNQLLRLSRDTIPQAGKTKTAAPAATQESAVVPEEKVAFDIPKNIDFTFRSNIKNAVLDKMEISDINGVITAQNGKLLLNGLHMKMLDGEMNVTGSYQNTPENQPLFDFGFNVIQFDIPIAFKTISGIQKVFPVAGQSSGKLNTTFKMNGKLSSSHKLIASSLDGLGSFSTVGVTITESPVFKQLKGILKPEMLSNVSIDDFKANFSFDDGNMELKPFKTKISGQETIISGSLNAQNLVNVRLDFNVNRSAFGTDIQNILSAIPGNSNISVLPAAVVIQGPVGKPEVKMDFSETRKTITNATKNELQNSLNKLGSGLKKLLDK